MIIITKKEALEKGLKRYFSGIPCKNGHVSERYTSTGHCASCVLISSSKLDKKTLSIKKKEYKLKNKEKLQHHNKLWKQNNKGKVNALKAKRKALKLQRTPPWANFEKIESIYLECAEISKSTGIIHHVDHIIPLQAEFVCGLHVHNNLQILTASENCSKRNTFEIQ